MRVLLLALAILIIVRIRRLWTGRSPRPVQATWTCFHCERSFPADQPRFIDATYGADTPFCIDCSH